MSVAALIRKFSHRESVPIQVDEVERELRDRGVKDEIYYWSAELDDKHLKGQLVQYEPWEYPTGVSEVYCADIYYANTLSDDWQRLVTCKELLHIIDGDAMRADKPEIVQQLLERIALSPELQDPLTDGMPTASDRFGIYQALAVLFPWATRQLLAAKFAAGNITIAEIARMVDLPPKYVALVMHKSWEEAHAILIDGA